MVIKRVKYFREFISKTEKINETNKTFNQEVSDEDNIIRSDIQREFDIYGTNGFGYDGKQFYTYSVVGNPNVHINTKENVKYITTYYISKSGASEDIHKNCDLEDFLLEKEFKKEEVKEE